MAIETYTIDTVQVKRADAATWTSDNPTLLDGEIGSERDTSKMKIGNGQDDWNTLGYITAVAVGATELVNLTDVSDSTPANRNALLGTGTSFASRALVLQDISDYTTTGVISDIDTSVGHSRWQAIEVPSGGTINQVLAKNSGTNYDVAWQTPSSNQHVIQEEGGNLTARTNLNFIGANVTATDNVGNDATDITIGGGGDMLLGTVQTNTAAKTFENTTLLLRNVADTFNGSFVNTNTADRIYTLQDAAGTLAFTTDITGTNSGTNTGDQTDITAISDTKANFNTALNDGNFIFVGDAPTSHTHLLAAGATDVTATASEVNLLDLAGLTAGWVLSADTATTASWKAQAGGSSLPVVDTTSIVEGSVDNTKELKFEVDGNTTSIIGTIATAFTTAKTITIPDATDTLVGKATTDTFTNKTFDANGTGNSLSNVDVADLANGTDGELITWSAAGAPTTVPVGTATHVLTSGGTGVAPTFQAVSVTAGTGTGTAFSITNTAGIFYNMGSANSGTTYTTTGTTTGGWAQGLINAATEPTVTGATKEGGAIFEASTDMYLVVYYNGTAMKFSFVSLADAVTLHPAELMVACSDEITDLTAGTDKFTFRMPYAMTVTDVRANVNTGGSGGNITVDINEGGTSILSTKLTIDGGTNSTGVLTLTSNFAESDTVTIDSKVYTFNATLGSSDGDVHIGASASASIDNLIGAITLASGTPGTDYASATTAHPTVTAAAGTGDTMDATAKVAGTAGDVASTETSANASWGNATLTGGVNPEKTSETAATAAVISDSTLADDAEISIDIDSIGTDDAGKGLKITLIGNRT